MSERSISEADVESTLKNPARGRYQPPVIDRLESFGYTLDGRRLNVITNRAVTVVISVVDE